MRATRRTIQRKYWPIKLDLMTWAQRIRLVFFPLYQIRFVCRNQRGCHPDIQITYLLGVKSQRMREVLLWFYEVASARLSCEGEENDANQQRAIVRIIPSLRAPGMGSDCRNPLPDRTLLF